MDSSITFASGDEWPSPSTFFGKLGNYFDRPEWWEEGAQTLKAFFDENTPHEDTTDQRLEDLLDLLEPLRVCEEPSIPGNAGANLSDFSAFQQEPKHDLSHTEKQSIELGSNDVQLQREPVTLSSNSFSSADPVHVEPAENGVIPAIANDIRDSRPSSEDSALVKHFPILGTDASSDAVNILSPLFAGTTTSTRQTSPQPDSSTRASSILADAAVSFNSSPEKETAIPSSSEKSKLGFPVRDATLDHEEDLPPGITEKNNDSALTDLAAPTKNGSASIPFNPTHNRASNEHSTTTGAITTVSENDPIGLQAIKDEISDEYELPKDIDSSMLTQEDDASVVHDPSAAATSFFPPNPYSNNPFDSSFYAAQDPSAAFNGNHEHVDDSSADSTLTSLASADGQLPESQPIDQVDVREGYTPSPPPISPLTPPPNFSDTTYVNADSMEKVGLEQGDDSALLQTASATVLPVNIRSDVTVTQDAGDDTLQEIKGFNAGDEIVDELGENNAIDGPKTSSDLLTSVNVKRKQEQPHADEPAPKRRLSPIAEDEHQPETNTETVPESGKKTVKGKSKRPAQKGKNKATPKLAQRDSPDELAPISPDELADASATNPFNLNRGSLKLGKTNLPPLRKLIGVQRATRKGVGHKELAGLLAASPPRKAAEKENSKVGGRLRSQSQTPAPASAADPAPVAAEVNEMNEPGTPAHPKRNRLPGTHPLSALELRELGDTPILETRTRTRTTTVEPTPDLATQDTAKPAPKRTKSAISNAEVERLGAVEMTESRTRNSTTEPTPVPTPAATPAKRAKKPKAAAQTVGKPSPFALTLKSKGTPSASRKRAPPKKKAAGPVDKKEPKKTKTPAKRKREEDGEKAEVGATRASKRVAGVEPEGQ